MILGGLWKILQAFLIVALSLFPTWEPPRLTPAWTALSAANIVLPLDVWSMLMGATVMATGAGLLVWVIRLAVAWIRGSG